MMLNFAAVKSKLEYASVAWITDVIVDSNKLKTYKENLQSFATNNF
jgi:hypothetical protein